MLVGIPIGIAASGPAELPIPEVAPAYFRGTILKCRRLLQGCNITTNFQTPQTTSRVLPKTSRPLPPRGGGLLAQFNQDSAATFWVNKHHQFIVGPFPGGIIQHPETFALQPLHLCFYILHFKGDVMHTLSPFIKKPGNRALRAGCLQQFDLIGPHSEKGGAYSLRRYHLLLIAGCP